MHVLIYNRYISCRSWLKPYLVLLLRVENLFLKLFLLENKNNQVMEYTMISLPLPIMKFQFISIQLLFCDWKWKDGNISSIHMWRTPWRVDNLGILSLGSLILLSSKIYFFHFVLRNFPKSQFSFFSTFFSKLLKYAFR